MHTLSIPPFVPFTTDSPDLGSDELEDRAEVGETLPHEGISPFGGSFAEKQAASSTRRKDKREALVTRSVVGRGVPVARSEAASRGLAVAAEASQSTVRGAGQFTGTDQVLHAIGAYMNAGYTVCCCIKWRCIQACCGL